MRLKHWVLSLLMLLLIGVSALQAHAEFYLAETRQWLDLWRDSPEDGREELLGYADKSISKLAWAPVSGANTPLLKGRLAYYRAIQNHDKRHLLTALKHFQSASRQRPLWPRGWAYESVARARLNDFDEEFSIALSSAISLGPNDGEVLKILFPTLALRWYRLNQEQQVELTDMIERIALTQPYWLINMIRDYGYEWRFCERELFRTRTGAFCEQAGWTPADN